MNKKLIKVGAALLLASAFLAWAVTKPATAASAVQQSRPYWPGSGPTARSFGWLKDFALDTDYNSTDFTTTLVENGTGEGDPVQNDAQYGTLSVIADENPADATQIQGTNFCFKLTAGKHTVFTVKFTTSAGDITDEDLLFGLCGSDTTAIAGHANGFTLEKPTGSAVMRLVCVANGGGTTIDYTNFTNLVTMVASTSYEWTLDICPLSSNVNYAYVKVWSNGSLVFNRTVTTDISNGSGTTYVLAPIVAVRNTTDTHDNSGFVLDYLGAAQDR